jgi:hypothetical protein
MKDIVQRLKMYLDHKSLGVIDLSIVLGYNSPQKLYRLFNTENASPSCQIIEDISNKFYDLNLNWLFSGRGNMIVDPNEQSDYKDKYYRCLEEKEDLYRAIIKSGK